MGEPADDEIYRNRTQPITLLDIDPEGDPQRAREDDNFFRAHMIRRLDELTAAVRGTKAGSNGADPNADLIEALNNNTRSNVALVKSLQTKKAPAATTEDKSSDSVGD